MTWGNGWCEPHEYHFNRYREKCIESAWGKTKDVEYLYEMNSAEIGRLLKQRWSELRESIITEENIYAMLDAQFNYIHLSGAYKRDCMFWGSREAYWSDQYIYEYTHKKIKKKLAELFHKIPKGKLGYGHKSMESLRPLIDEIASLIMSQNPSLLEEYKRLKKDLEERDLRVRRICESQHIDPERYMLTDKYLKDFNRRVGNKIIEYAKKYELDSKWEGLSYEKQALMRNRIKRNNTLLFKSTATLNKMVAREADKVFTDFRKRLKEAEYQRLVEEGVIEAE